MTTHPPAPGAKQPLLAFFATAEPRWLACFLFLWTLIVPAALWAEGEAQSAAPREAAGQARSNGPRRVLILNSYHPGMHFSDEEVRGIRSVLPPGTEVFLEYMDTKRIQGEAYLTQLAQLYAMKYAHSRFDTIFSLDDDALRFLLARAGRLFPETPVVFCGVNALQSGMLDNQPWFTGVLETIDIEASLDFALRMLPQTTQVLVITDPTTTGAANRQTLERLARSGAYKQPFVFLDPDGSGLEIDTLVDTLRRSPAGSIVYYADFYKDRQGHTVNAEAIVPLVASHAPGPVFVHNATYLGYGVLGGKLNSGFDQGVTAGHLALQMWQGKKAAEIPVLTENANRVMVDHQSLDRWNIPRSAVLTAAGTEEKNIIFLHKPEPFWRGRGGYFLAGLGFIVFQAVLIAWLFQLLQRQQQLRREARNAAERFRALFDLAPFACVVNDQAGRYLMVNRAFTQITGITAAEALGRTSQEAGVLLDRSAVRAIKRELDKHGVVAGMEVPVTIRRHRFLHTLQASAMIDWESGPVILSATADITTIRQAEAALRESEERYRELVENASIIIIKFDISGVLTFVNAYALKFFGFTEEELLGRNVVGTIVPEIDSNGQDLRVMMAAICQDTETFRDNINENMTRDGQRLWIHWNNRVIRDEHNRICEILSFGSDMTRRKQAEDERERLRDQLLQAQKMESVGRLAGGVAHDFNNMLGVIIGHAELALTDAGLGTRLRHDLQQILTAAERSAELTRQLLAFARKQPIAPKVLDLNQSITEMLKMLRRLIGEDVQLLWRPGEGLWPVRIDPTQLTQILANLSINAKDAVVDDGQIVIETANTVLDAAYCTSRVGCIPGEYVQLMVCDNGCGMDQATQERIFDPFFTTKGHGQGTGLGLSTVSGIVTQNHGLIECASEPGQGTTFRLYLPRFVGEVEEETIAEPPVVVSPGSGTILLVEDEQVLLEMSEAMLETLGYTVLIASTAEEALRWAREYTGVIDLLITDVIMPGMNGKELAARLTAIRPAMRCLFMSGYPADVIAHQGMIEQGVRFIQKPFTKTALAAKVREALPERSMHAPDSR
ncbi:multi-sensor hybrid histidine kinase [Desulfobulbus propionicus DSM 2032]|uniref:histidine kinase n=1 Tax=Desulfobulbus propionicus (strain ATCC 33891 / DSM 2032 / VKM B-1956 / 1pr3) TaxID=577650 RepID=A0A7U3YLP3_DESPD|nr:PAS domain S-box protein [Desulfobulbus propionicus]ADW17683.1 multi-sensor hybrid histidine kinase [Desulfobulbus propionicus DSM 2032]